jgi:hypothetical protein
MTKPKKTTIPDPESLSSEERNEIVKAAIERDARETEDWLIRRELQRRADEAERRASS